MHIHKHFKTIQGVSCHVRHPKINGIYCLWSLLAPAFYRIKLFKNHSVKFIFSCFVSIFQYILQHLHNFVHLFYCKQNWWLLPSGLEIKSHFHVDAVGPLSMALIAFFHTVTELLLASGKCQKCIRCPCLVVFLVCVCQLL